MDCKFCDIIDGKVEDYKVWENEKFLIFLDKNPAKPGHCLLIPKRHIDYFFDLDDDIYVKLLIVAKRFSEPLRAVTKAKKIGIAVVGFNVPHAHLHLVPLHNRNEMSNLRSSVEAKPEELREVQQKIKNCLEEVEL